VLSSVSLEVPKSTFQTNKRLHELPESTNNSPKRPVKHHPGAKLKVLSPTDQFRLILQRFNPRPKQSKARCTAFREGRVKGCHRASVPVIEP
jgi:hypothetical protein